MSALRHGWTGELPSQSTFWPCFHNRIKSSASRSTIKYEARAPKGYNKAVNLAADASQCQPLTSLEGEGHVDTQSSALLVSTYFIGATIPPAGVSRRSSLTLCMQPTDCRACGTCGSPLKKSCFCSRFSIQRRDRSSAKARACLPSTVRPWFMRRIT